jgi:hypothetical protein
MRRVNATRYVTALREGGSLPGLVEADDDGLYVVKFRGAGQGPGVLVSEVVAGELGRAIGLRIPELVVIDVSPELGHAEPDVEIQELINASPGANLGMDFLPGALPFDGSSTHGIDPAEAAAIVWFDWLITNVDRTPRNPNLLTWHGDLWLIDHGAAFFRQHGQEPLSLTSERPTPMLKEHVLLPCSGSVMEAGERLAGSSQNAIGSAVTAVPSEWLGSDPESAREQFRLFLMNRLEDSGQMKKDLYPDD